MRISVVVDLDDEWCEPEHVVGISEEAHEKIYDFMSEFGTVVNIIRDVV